MSRYEGKPLLRLLECYVLDTIGELSAKDRGNLEKITPKLQAIYKLNGHWRSILTHVMHFPATLDDDIRSQWASYGEVAPDDEGRSAEDFARMIVDEKLVSG